MDNQAEINNGGAKNQEQVRFQQFLNEFKEALAEKIRIIESSDESQEQKNQKRAELSTEYMNDLREKLTALERIKKTQQDDRTTVTEAVKEQQEEAKKGAKDALARTIIASGKDLELTKDKTAQAILNEFSKGSIDAEQAGRIAEKLGPYITGAKDIIITKPGEERSEFLKDIDSYKSEDPVIYEKMKGIITNRHELFNLTTEQSKNVFPTEVKEQVEDQRNEEYEQMREQVFLRDQSEYYGRFTQDQQEFLHKLYSPAKFKEYVEKQINNPKGENEKKEYKKSIAEIYKEQKKDIPDEQHLDKLADDVWRQHVSHNIEMELGEVMNQLLLRLQQEGAQKFYDELAQQDFMRGIQATENQIRSALTTLQSNLAELEKNPKYSKEYEKVKLYKFFDEGHYIDEREKIIDGDIRSLPYPRLHPLLQPKEIGLKDFALQLTFEVNHLIHQRNYLHDARVVFNHPPGEHGFYPGLGSYAEKYAGTDIDEMMLLPDGNLALEAYHLYEKYLEEDFASLDWKHRPTEFTSELEYVNSKLEKEIIEQMKLEYGNDISEERIKSAVNIGVGLARGVFLTEPEKSAYADPVDNEGRGMIASYGTNDAGALNALNPLHVELRWQGEHHMFMYYFMPIHGEKGGLWNHKKLWDNMGNYMDSYIKGNAKLPKHLFIDEMIGVTKAGGIFQRKGWRMQASLEGFYKYYKDMNKEDHIDALKSFKAMDYIGYEAVADFFDNKKMGLDMLQAEEGTDLAGKRKELFEDVYKKYFEKFDGADFDGYMADLKKLGEEQALKVVRGEAKGSKGVKGTLPAGSWEKQVELETSNIFLERAKIREIALRFPSKFLRIDRSRFSSDGKSRWQIIQKKEMHMSRDDFNAAMKDFVFTETLLRKEMSEKIKNQLHLDPTLNLNEIEINYESLNEATIERLLKLTKGVGEDGKLLMTSERIERVKQIYRAIEKNFLNGEFLNKAGIEAVKDYPFSFGVEDTDIGLMAFRGTGPRMVARAIKDVGILEEAAIPAIAKLGRMLQTMAIDGKHDFSPIIEAMIKARAGFNEVHGTGDDQKFNYILATAVIQHFKKDTMAKPLFGLFRLGKTNSWAAKYAGRSSAVWEWDSRDIDRFITALESYRILPKTAFDIFEVRKGGQEYENVYWINPITKKPFKTPFKKQKVSFEYNGDKLRKEFGGDLRAISFDMINQFLPIAMAFLLWKYIKEAMDEVSGTKKK